MPTWRDVREAENLRALHDAREMTSHAIQSQYSASKKILALAAAFNTRLDPRADMDVFYTDIMDIYTASGWGLDNWGWILAMPRTIDDADTVAALTLEDEYYRLLLYKALANISASDLATLNSLLVDTMVIRWVFEGFLNDTRLAVFKTAGTLARGAGVGWEL